MYRRRNSFVSQLSPEGKRKAIIAFAVIFTMLFIAATVVTLKSVYHKLNYCTETTQGVITKVSYHSAKYGGDYAYVQYKVQGTLYEIKMKKNIGDVTNSIVIIHYNPQDPTDSYMGDYPVNPLYAVGSVILYIVFMVAFVVTLKKKKGAEEQ